MQKSNSEIISHGPSYTNEQFDALYPESIRNLSKRHWTPLNVAKKAAAFLASGRNPRILDIGSGAGKFCLVGAQHRPKALFFGFEQRQSLISEAEKVKKALSITNVSFIHENFSRLDFNQFDHFYF
jgi:tRNA G46 methylase TrmB